MKESLPGRESLSFYRPEVIFILSSGLYSSEANRTGLKPSWDSRMRLVAAAEIFESLKRSGHNPEVIITGGRIYKGQPELSTIGKQILVKNYKIPESQISTVGGSNTLEEFGIIANIIRERGLTPEKFAVITNDYHLTAQKLANKLGIRFFSTESILIQRDEHYRSVVGDIVESGHYQMLLNSQKNRSRIINAPFGRIIYKIADKWVKQKVELSPFDYNGLRVMFSRKEESKN